MILLISNAAYIYTICESVESLEDQQGGPLPFN